MFHLYNAREVAWADLAKRLAGLLSTRKALFRCPLTITHSWSVALLPRALPRAANDLNSCLVRMGRLARLLHAYALGALCSTRNTNLSLSLGLGLLAQAVSQGCEGACV